MTVSELKADGYKVHFTHVRQFPDGFFKWDTRGERPGEIPLPTGGATYCDIILGEDILATGRAACSERDNFCRKIGRDIAFGRAVAEMTGTAEIRRARRESYHLAESA